MISPFRTWTEIFWLQWAQESSRWKVHNQLSLIRQLGLLECQCSEGHSIQENDEQGGQQHLSHIVTFPSGQGPLE